MIFSLDIIIIASVLLVFTVFFFYFGKNTAIGTIISLYLGLLLYNFIPKTKIIIFNKNAFETNLNHIAIFIILTLISYFLIKKHIHSFISDTGALKSFLFALPVTILILIISQFFVKIDGLYDFGLNIDKIFGNFDPFYWLLLPLILLAFI